MKSFISKKWRIFLLHVTRISSGVYYAKLFETEQEKSMFTLIRIKVKQSRYMPWRRLEV
jgi:hypothetical protein